MDGWRHFLAVVIFLLHCIDCKDYCHNEEFLADCRPHLSDKTHRLVLIDRALYGRMSLGPCVKTDFGFVGCYNDVTPYVHSRCSGRTSCTVRVPDPLLDLTNPCNEDLKSYLQANFSCVEISQPSQDGLCKAVIPVGNTPLYFARISSNFGVTGSNLGDGRSDCGLPTKPWVVTAQVGQKLNITLLDFSKASNDFTLSSHPLASLSSSSSSSSSSFARQRNVIKRQPSYHVKRSVNIRHESQRKSVKGDDDDDDSHHHIQRRHRPQNLNDPRLTPNDLNLSPSLRDLTCDQYAMVEELLGSMLHPSPLKPKTPSSSSSSSSSSSPSSSSSSSNPTIKHYLCGNGTQPWTRSYVSQTHQVRLSMLLPYLENHYYIIKIQAVGCPDSLPTPSNSWMRRESENEMVVGCLDEFQHTWTLTCIDNRWEGEPWNCSAAGKKGSVPPELGPFSIGAAVFVVVGVSLFIGLLVLFIGLYYIKRRRAASCGGQLNMRDLRPLNCESFSPNVIANNQQQQLHNNKPSSTTSTVTTTSGKSRGKNNKDYECVWEVPSGKSLTLLARDSSPNKKFNQYLNENRVSSTVNKLDSFKQKNLIVKAPFKDDLRQKVFFGNSQISGKTSGTCTCCCQEKFNTDSNHLRRIAPAVTSVGHVTIGHAPRVDDVTTTVTGHRKPPSCLTFPKQSSVAMGAARQNQLNDRCFKSSDLLEDEEEELPASRVCQHCGHSATTTACDGAPISESTPSIFVDSTAPAPVLPYRLVPPGSETLTRKPFLPSLALDAAEIFKRSQDSGMPSSLGSIGRDPLTSQQRHQQRLSQRHSVPRETTNNNDNNNMSTESAETPPILHPRKRRT